MPCSQNPWIWQVARRCPDFAAAAWRTGSVPCEWSSPGATLPPPAAGRVRRRSSCRRGPATSARCRPGPGHDLGGEED